MSTEPSDAELVARCLEAREAFEQLYRRHAPVVFAFLKGMHRGDEHAAADSLQETFFKAWSALGTFDASRPLRPWLFKIASNAAIDALARTKRLEPRDPAQLPEPAAPAPASGETGDACARLIRAASERLPARKLAAFLLARAQGLSYDEVARIHDCSEATVKRDLKDALAALTGVATELGLV
jgi:RNA polymerase sigma-70 factor (ECF subfamily)